MTKVFLLATDERGLVESHPSYFCLIFGQRGFQVSILLFNAQPVGIGHLSSASLLD
jgi:hypothetical protein